MIPAALLFEPSSSALSDPWPKKLFPLTFQCDFPAEPQLQFQGQRDRWLPKLDRGACSQCLLGTPQEIFSLWGVGVGGKSLEKFFCGQSLARFWVDIVTLWVRKAVHGKRIALRPQGLMNYVSFVFILLRICHLFSISPFL